MPYDIIKMKKYLEVLAVFIKENDKLAHTFPGLNLSENALIEWYKRPVNKNMLKFQRDVVQRAYSDLLQAWKDLCKDIDDKCEDVNTGISNS